MNLSRINKIQGLQGRDYEIEFLRALTGKDLEDVLLTFEGLTSVTDGILYEEILLADFQAKSAEGTLTPGKTYAITDLLSSLGDFRLLLKGFNNTDNNGVANGVLISLNTLSSTPIISVLDVQFDILNGIFLSFYNRAYDVRFTSLTLLSALNISEVGSAYYNGRITKCDFSNYTGTLTFDIGSFTTLKNCDFSNSSADFDTSELTSAATFSGRILNDFAIPDQTSFPCDFTNTVNINADGTTDLQVNITLAAAQTELDMSAYASCAGVLKLIPDAGGNSITTITNGVAGREYKIVSDDDTSLLQMFNNPPLILFTQMQNTYFSGTIGWNSSGQSMYNEIYFKGNGTGVQLLEKSSIY